MNVREEDFPTKFRLIIRRLQRAMAEPEVRKTMDIEDEILEELQEKEREIARGVQIIEENKKTIEEKDLKIEENKKTIEEKDQTIKENKKTIEEKDKLIKELQEKLNNR
jgi:methyl-accepting chemotaxis protein